MRALSDAQLASLAAAGERVAFGELLRRHAPSVRVTLRRMGASPEVADDIAQDACLKAFERIDTYRGDGPFGAWLRKIAARLFIRRWRSESRMDWTGEPSEDIPDHIAPLAFLSDAIDLDNALDQLSGAERLCISLCVGVGMTHGEAASELRMPIGTVKSHVHRGLVKLRSHFAVQETPGSEARRARA